MSNTVKGTAGRGREVVTHSSPHWVVASNPLQSLLLCSLWCLCFCRNEARFKQLRQGPALVGCTKNYPIASGSCSLHAANGCCNVHTNVHMGKLETRTLPSAPNDASPSSSFYALPLTMDSWHPHSRWPPVRPIPPPPVSPSAARTLPTTASFGRRSVRSSAPPPP